MKLLSTAALLLLCACSRAQVDTTRELPKVNASGNAVKNLEIDSSIRFPTDTPKLKSSWRSIQFKGNKPYFWGGQYWTGFQANFIAGIGTTKSSINDTISGGGLVNGIQRYVVKNPFVTGRPFGYIQLINADDADSLADYALGVGGRTLTNEGMQLVDVSYAPSMLSISRNLTEWKKDTANLQYGGMVSMLAHRVLDSVSSRFGTTAGGKKPLWLTDPGIEIINQTFLPKDTLDIAAWPDGVSGAAFHSITGIGSHVGYNAHVGGLFPWTGGFMSTLDLQREASRHTKRRMTGNGFSGMTFNYRSWQQTMSTTGTEGHYISSVAAITDVGNTDTSIGPSLTKAQILARSEIDSAFTLKIEPIWRPHNEVRNGYSFYAKGDSDLMHLNGFLYLGGQLPTHQNGLWPQYRFSLMGDGYTDGSMWFNKGGRIVGGNTVSTWSAPTYLYMIGKDSSTNIYQGMGEDKGGTLLMYGKYENAGNSGGIDYYVNDEYANGVSVAQSASTSGIRYTFYNRGNYFFNRYNLGFNKFKAIATDSISFTSNAYKFNGMPSGPGVKQLRMDASGYISQTDTLISTSDTYTVTVTGGANYASSSAIVGSWTRNGKIVDVTVSGNVTATAGAAAVIFDLSLPIASNLIAQQDLHGNGVASYAGSNETAFVLGNTVNDRATVSTSTIASTNARFFVVTFKYEVK